MRREGISRKTIKFSSASYSQTSPASSTSNFGHWNLETVIIIMSEGNNQEKYFKYIFPVVLILFLSLYYGNTISRYLFHTGFTYLSRSQGEIEVKRKWKYIRTYIILYFIIIFQWSKWCRYIFQSNMKERNPILCVLWNQAKWSFKGLFSEFIWNFPEKVTICPTVYYISIFQLNFPEKGKEMHNVIGQDIRNLVLDQCITKEGRKEILWIFHHNKREVRVV